MRRVAERASLRPQLSGHRSGERSPDAARYRGSIEVQVDRQGVSTTHGAAVPMRRITRLIVGAVFAVTFFLLAGFMLFAARVVHFATAPSVNPAPVTDAVVVLTGGERRILEGTRVFGQGRASRLLISGVNRQTSREDLFRVSRLPPVLFECCVDIGYEALDTIGNAQETKRWASTWGYRRLLVVTSSYHMPRSLAELARAMPQTELVPYPVPSRGGRRSVWWLDSGAFKLVALEYAKFLPAAARLLANRALHAFADRSRSDLT